MQNQNHINGHFSLSILYNQLFEVVNVLQTSYKNSKIRTFVFNYLHIVKYHNFII